MKLKTGILLAISLCFLQISYSQRTDKRIVITGIITDSTKNPIEGAAIFIDDKNTNSVTNYKGQYKVKVNHSSQKISVLSVQGGTSEDLINGRTEINFVMGNDLLKMLKGNNENENDETISDGYITENKKNSATSVSKVNAQNPKYKSYQNIYDMLRGEVSGVKIIGTKIQIMGPSSFNGNDDPLFIVDGVPVEKIDYISPGEVQSIEILKGASASIYGTRGANGVLLINLINAKDKRER
jgi:TonB-dependent starch-binding outer membrane protein SusC